jgi:hypothetical protein
MIAKLKTIVALSPIRGNCNSAMPLNRTTPDCSSTPAWPVMPYRYISIPMQLAVPYPQEVQPYTPWQTNRCAPPPHRGAPHRPPAPRIQYDEPASRPHDSYCVVISE